MKTVLRPRQEQTLYSIKKSIAGGNKRVMVQAPTGYGKTVVGSAIVEGAINKGNRVVFTVPSISLINQTVEKFQSEGLMDIGVIQADHEMTNPLMPIQVASIQTLMRRKLPDVDVAVIDEAHIWYKFYSEWFEAWNNTPFIGLSATPWTKGLGKYYQDLIIGSTIQDEINEKHLSNYIVYAPTKPDLKGVRSQKTSDGDYDYNEKQLDERMNTPKHVGEVVGSWLELGENEPTLFFGVTRAHAKNVCNQFNEKGIPAAYIDAFTPADERDRIGQQLADGEIKIVCNVGCLIMGVDWDVRCIILDRPTKSEMRFVQMVGRGLRMADGKQRLILIDHTATHYNLGEVIDIHHTELDDGKPKKKTKPVIKFVECQHCNALIKQGTVKCKHCDTVQTKKCTGKQKVNGIFVPCGFDKPVNVHQCPQCGFAPDQQSDIDRGDGELVLLGKKKPSAAQKRNKEHTNAEKEFFYGELKHYAQNKGFKGGWASNKYRERYGVWPNHYSNAPLVQPTAATLNWIRSQNIRWANSPENPKNKRMANG